MPLLLSLLLRSSAESELIFEEGHVAPSEEEVRGNVSLYSEDLVNDKYPVYNRQGQGTYQIRAKRQLSEHTLIRFPCSSR